jgi:hypothetical protein
MFCCSAVLGLKEPKIYMLVFRCFEATEGNCSVVPPGFVPLFRRVQYWLRITVPLVKPI